VINVQVFLHSTLVKFSNDGKTRKFTISIPPGSTINDLLSTLRIEQTGYHLLFAVNGKVADEEQRLNENDSVHLMMPISGG